MWSIGVIIFILLGGYPPFYNECREKQNNQIRNCDYQFDETWDNVSSQAKTMIKALLVIDTKNRLSAMDALRHPWMRTERAILRRHSLHSSQKSIEAYFVRERFQSAVKKVSVLSTHHINSLQESHRHFQRQILQLKGHGIEHYANQCTGCMCKQRLHAQ